MRLKSFVLLALCGVGLGACGDDVSVETPPRVRSRGQSSAQPPAAPKTLEFAGPTLDDAPKIASPSHGKALYLAEMRREGTWGGAVELAALSSVLEAPIAIYMPQGQVLQQQARLEPSRGSAPGAGTYCIRLDGGHYSPIGLWRADAPLPETFGPEDDVPFGTVAADGNCLFASIGALVGHPAAFLRQIACDALQREFSDDQLADEWADLQAFRRSRGELG